MVFELKSHKGDAPGVLIFSHKEYKLLFNKKSENAYSLKDVDLMNLIIGLISEDTTK